MSRGLELGLLASLVASLPAHADYSHRLDAASGPSIGVVSHFEDYPWNHTLTNVGDETDTYLLTIENEFFSGTKSDWVWSLCTSGLCVLDSVSVTLMPAAEESISVHVAALGAPGGTRTILTVRSLGEPADVTVARYLAIHTDTRTLLVDDDGGDERELCYVAALERSGVPYGVWETGVQELVATDLDAMDTVVWVAGASFGAVTSADATNLAGFLDGGGNLAITGHGVLDDIDGSAFASGYLGVARSGATTQISVLGEVGNPVGGAAALSLDGGSCAPAAISHDVLTPTNASVAFRYGDGTVAGVTRGSPGFRTVTLGFGLESADEAGRRAVVQSILDWFAAPVSVEPESWAQIKARYR